MSSKLSPQTFDKDAALHIYDSLFNAGYPASTLTEQAITPTERFFVRNHALPPKVDPASYRLRVTGKVGRTLSLSLAELRTLPEVTLTATLQCAGNRRKELMGHAAIDDQLGWHLDGIGTATWTGVRLADVLRMAEAHEKAGHVAFLGLDQVEKEGKAPFPYGSSIPMDKALCPESLLVYGMNGADLPVVHGAPLRGLIGGYIGARSVKWLSEIRVQDTPSDNYYQQVAYKLFPPHVSPETVDYEQGLMLGELSLNAAITSPTEGDVLPIGTTTLRGYAMAGGGRSVAFVEVSTDGGATWAAAQLGEDLGRYAWRLWRADVTLNTGEHELIVRAWDSSANTQPSSVADVWNFKGYMNNSWHRVRVRVG